MSNPVGEAFKHGLESVHDSIHEVAEKLDDLKPKLRGWLHLGTAPLTLAAGIVLIVLSPTTTARIGSIVFIASALVLFTVSAIYHTGTWSPRTWAFLRRFDHANIFVLIAGTYTPFSLLLLDGTAQVALLVTVWTGAILGVLFRVFWTDAPRWLFVPIYMALGWSAVFFIPSFFHGATALGLGIGDRGLRADRRRRRALHRGRRRLRLQAPQPVTALVRLPRGLPLVHDPGLRLPLRRDLDGHLRAEVVALAPVRLRQPQAWRSEATCERSERAPRFGLAPVTTAKPASAASVVTGVGPKLAGVDGYGLRMVVPRPCSIVIIEASCWSAFSVRANVVSARSGLNRCRAMALA